MSMVHNVFTIKDHKQFKRKTVKLVLLFFIGIALLNILIYRWNVEKIIQSLMLVTITYFPLLLLVIFIFYFESKPVSIPIMMLTFTTCLLTYLLLLIIVMGCELQGMWAFLPLFLYFFMKLSKLIYKRRKRSSLRN
jgi:hypothetical protein